MHPLVPYLLGQEHPEGRRLVNCQRCIRTKDIEDVGDASHLTFFEMLGNWSLGDYFKQEAIEMSFEFLTSSQYLGVAVEDIAVTVFAGNAHVAADEESARMWEAVGIPRSKIFFLGEEHNWWGPAGQTGPCGPDSEIFIDTKNNKDSHSTPGTDDGRYVEVWNNVFMQYNKTAAGGFLPLQRRCVDTGMGLERSAAILQKKQSVYHTELFIPIIQHIETLSSERFDVDERKTRAMRIIADHIRAAVFILGDQRAILPSNIGQGYILRRLIRRAMRFGRQLGIESLFLSELAELVVKIYAVEHPRLEQEKSTIFSELQKEEKRFFQTLDKGERELKKLFADMQLKGKKRIEGKDLFHLYDTYGFPKEISSELAHEHNLEIDEEGFAQAYNEHQAKSKTDVKQTFKGGLQDASEVVVRLHTATHLLHQALRIVLGLHVSQKGSNITKERLRFDFSHPNKMTEEEISRVEAMVNDAIQASLPIRVETKSLEAAKKEGALAFFTDTYDEKVTVYSIGDFSKEVCGGPHVENTKKLGFFKIVKEQSSSMGVRRIKATLE
ncbi:alanine--tRNA ligase-like [Ylistrum balloti]|uniref:alanine--tRNA ligase-like n=1 Tax=Ylistrum balloti TaxID=509963 RepID=UPI002905C0AB|nr:alanine--tRNA ligase-like [Ylistrum balloti]